MTRRKLTYFLGIFIIVTLFGCAKSNSVDKQFLTDFHDAIINRTEMADKGATHREIVNSEYPILIKYKDTEFDDKSLKEIYDLYMEGLETQKSALDKSLKYSEYDIQWQEGIVKRFKAIKQIHENFDVFENDKQLIENTYVNQLETKEKYCTAYKEISDDLVKQTTDKMLDYNGYRVLLPYTNNTNYTFDMSLHFVFFDSKGNRIADQSPYFSDIKPNVKNKFEIFITLPDSGGGRWECNWTIENIY